MPAPASHRSIVLCCSFFCIGLLLANVGRAQMFFEETTEKLDAALFKDRSTAFGDYDNDGRPDLFLAEDFVGRWDYRLALLHNEGDGRFADQTASLQADIPGHQLKGGGAVFGDYDNDGDLDLFIPIGSFLPFGNGPNVLLRNDRGIFTDVAMEAGLTGDEKASDNAIWLDYDRDGHIDLYVGNVADSLEVNRLYRNNGDGTFTDQTESARLNTRMGSNGGRIGGSNGGMVGSDFDGDGWPDIYIAVNLASNRLFLNDGQGGFRDATSGDLIDPGGAFGVTAGDIDNDGDMDIFQTGAGFGALLHRPLMLLNLSGGEFLDVTEGVGLSNIVRIGRTLGASLLDIDNDGDLDLLAAHPHFLFLNNGNGTFEDATIRSGVADVSAPVSYGDYDMDGFLDLMFGSDASVISKGRLFHNLGNDNRWLRVELVGIQSNRSGIGTRLIATSGDLQQTRDMLGGLGRSQDELIVHFGLGERSQVDRLEIRWPSGQVDVLTDISADQRIRVFEGKENYHVVQATIWEHNIPDISDVGETLDLSATVFPALFEEDAVVTRVTADLSDFNGPDDLPLKDMGNGTYRLETRSPALEGVGPKTVRIRIEQMSSLGPYWSQLSKTVRISPDLSAEERPEDGLRILDEGLSASWQTTSFFLIEALDFAQEDLVYEGKAAGAFLGKEGSSGWVMVFKSEVRVPVPGYRALRFAFRPGDIVLPSQNYFIVRLEPGRGVFLLDSRYNDRRYRVDDGVWVDMDRKEWQVIEIPLEAFDLKGPIESVQFSGKFTGTFYLDDIQIVAAETPSTVLMEDYTSILPENFSLMQNYPNPFNSATVIRFALPTSEDVDLAIFNLAGQQVATLVSGMREAGTYTIRWDGRDDDGQALASGVYLYRLRTSDGQQVETRKLLLLR